MTIKRGPAYTYKATTDKTIHLSFSAEADPRRWRVTIWRKRRGTVPVVVWAKVYKRKASADRAARDYPRRFAAELVDEVAGEAPRAVRSVENQRLRAFLQIRVGEFDAGGTVVDGRRDDGEFAVVAPFDEVVKGHRVPPVNASARSGAPRYMAQKAMTAVVLMSSSCDPRRCCCCR